MRTRTEKAISSNSHAVCALLVNPHFWYNSGRNRGSSNLTDAGDHIDDRRSLSELADRRTTTVFRSGFAYHIMKSGCRCFAARVRECPTIEVRMLSITQNENGITLDGLKSEGPLCENFRTAYCATIGMLANGGC